MTTTRVLITGVRGKTGTPLAGLLAARGVEVRGGSSDPSRVDLDGVVPTAFDWDDPAGWARALDGVDAVFVVRPDRPDAPALVADLAAATAPGTRLVLLSERAADHPALEGWSLGSEQAVRDAGRPFVVLRPSWFMQVLSDDRFHRDDVVDRGELPFADGAADVAWIDARDIAAVAERALLDPALDGRVLEITGPEALSFPEVARRLAAALGRPVEHRSLTVEEALATSDGFDRHLLEVTLRRVHDGTFSLVTGTVEEVTGRPARSLGEFLAEDADALRRG